MCNPEPKGEYQHFVRISLRHRVPLIGDYMASNFIHNAVPMVCLVPNPAEYSAMVNS